jgi:hypothetical protein
MRYANPSYITVAGLIMLMWSCVKDPKDIPSGFTEDAVFGMQGSFGNESIDIGAGTNGWTMLPSTSRNDSLTIYSSVFSKDGCLDQCPGSWTFHFFQNTPFETDAVTAFENTIKVGKKGLVEQPGTLDSFNIHLTTHPGLFMSGISYWQDTVGNNFYEHTYTTSVSEEQNMFVCFESFAYTGCHYSQCLSFDPQTIVPCISYIEPILESARYVSLGVRPSGTPPFTYEWYNGATSQNIVVALQDSFILSELYAGVTVTDANGNKSTLSQIVRVQAGVVDPCYFPISLISTPVSYEAEQFLTDRVDLLYVDESGDFWRASGGMQLPGYEMSIESVEPYGVSPSGEDAFLMTCSVNALLYHELTGEAKVFTMPSMTIALSHP